MKDLKALTEYCLISVKQFSAFLKVFIGISIGAVLVFILLGINISPIYYLALLILLPLTILEIIIYRKSILQKLIRQLREDWGKEKDRKRNFSEIESFYRYTSRDCENSGIFLDDQTWSDLNMNELYSQIDRTMTNPGECVLYNILRKPFLSAPMLKKRNEIIRLFQADKHIREQVQIEFLRLGMKQGNTVTTLVYEEVPPLSNIRFLFSFLALLALLSIVIVPFLWGAPGIFFVVIPLYIVNLLASYKIRAGLAFQIGAIRYLGAMIRIAQKISTFNCPELRDYCEKLKKAASASEKIASKTFLLSPENYFSSDFVTLLYAHADTYFLREVRIFYRVLDEIRAHQEDIKLIYSLIGELDALQSAASYREGFPGYIEPSFSHEEILLEIKDARHPLLPNPVPNSITIREKGVSITGSNMAGKTTFLRTLGVNIVLAQTIYMCFADSYHGNYFRIISLVNEADSLIEGKSYYLVQAEHLLRMVEASQKEVLTLCLIDEPLAGTNSSERLAASFEILRFLVEHNALVVIATHDLELARKLEFGFKSYHFTDDIDEKGLRFDYKLKEGVTTTSNAIKLLEFLNYPGDITKNAMQNLA